MFYSIHFLNCYNVLFFRKSGFESTPPSTIRYKIFWNHFCCSVVCCLGKITNFHVTECNFQTIKLLFIRTKTIYSNNSNDKSQPFLYLHLYFNTITFSYVFFFTFSHRDKSLLYNFPLLLYNLLRFLYVNMSICM